MEKRKHSANQARPQGTALESRARQSAKIKELGSALAEGGYRTLDEQSKAFGLSRSTTWALFRSRQKIASLSPTLIKCMLASPQLPRVAREQILEYIDEKAAGLYGHSQKQRSRFVMRLSGQGLPRKMGH